MTPYTQEWVDQMNARVARGRTELPLDDDARRLAADAVIEESKLDEFIREDCKSRGWIAIKSRNDKKTRRKKGEWDWHILASGGRTFYVESKKRGEKPSTEQRDLFHWAACLGHKVHVVWSPEQFLEVVK